MKWTEKCILNLAHHNLFENDGHRHRFYDLLDCYFDKPFFTKGLCKCMYLSAWDTEHFSMMLETLNATLIEHDFRLHLMRDQGQIEQAEAHAEHNLEACECLRQRPSLRQFQSVRCRNPLSGNRIYDQACPSGIENHR